MSWARWFFGDLLLPGHRKFTMYQVLLQYICTYFFLYFAAVIFLVSHKKINIKLIEVLYTLLKMHHECDTFLWFCIICNFLRKQYPQWNQGQNGMQFCFNLFIRWCTVSHIVNQKVQKMLANGNLRLTILYFQGRQSGLKSVGAQRGRAGNFGVFLPRNRENYGHKPPTFGVAVHSIFRGGFGPREPTF